MALLLGACSSGDGIEVAPLPQQVTGTVFQPEGAQVAARGAGFVARLAAFFSRAAQAAITGLTPLGNVTVELVQLGAVGDVLQVLDATTAGADGSFEFEVNPPLSSTLAVQVPGQATTMRAIVTGPVVDITPASELAVESASNTIGGLVGFSVSEMAALTSLLRGVDIDLANSTSFGDAVDRLAAEASGLIAGLIPALEATGPQGNAVLRSRNFSAIDFSLTLRDPFWLEPENDGGIEISGAQTTLVFGRGSDRPQIGLEFGDVNHFLHDLVEVRNIAASGDFMPGRDLSEVLHVVTAGGQLLLADGEQPELDVAGVGAVRAPDGSALFVYPLSLGIRPSEAGRIDELQASGMGLRFAAEWSVSDSNPDLSRLDGEYNVVQLRHALSGAASGVSSVSAATAAGVMAFDGSTPIEADFDGLRAYGSVTFSSSGLPPQGEALDLATFALGPLPEAQPSVPPEALYYVLPSTAFVQLRHTDGAILGFGAAADDGEVAVFSTASGGFPNGVPLDPDAALAGLATRSLSVAIRRPASAPAAFGVYNLVHYAVALSGEAGETGFVTNEIRHGRVRLDVVGDSGTIMAAGGPNGLISKRSALDVGLARAEEEAAGPALFAATRMESVPTTGGSFDLPQSDGTIGGFTLQLVHDGGVQTLSGSGAVSADGSFIALAIEGTDGVARSRGMLFLVREPEP